MRRGVSIAIPGLLAATLGFAGPSAGKDGAPVTLTLYTDFICPFCYIAEHSTLPRLVKAYDVRVDWRGFQLHPDTPPGGIALSEYFAGRDFTAMHRHVAAFAGSFGVDLPNPPAHMPNTRKALAAAEFARDQGKLDPFREAMQQAYWRDGRDLEADATIRAAAKTSGLDPDRTVAAAADRVYLAKVDANARQALAAGVQGIPTFVFTGEDAVVGCQPYEALEAAARAAGARPRGTGGEKDRGRGGSR